MTAVEKGKLKSWMRDIKSPYLMGSVLLGPYGNVNYLDRGPKDGEVIVCVHGFNGSMDLFTDLQTVLSTTYRVIAYDLYGHGESDAPAPSIMCGLQRKNKYDLDFYADQLHSLLVSIFQAPQRFVLLGFSIGGIISVNFARRFPQLIKKLILVAPAGFLIQRPRMHKFLKACSCCLIPTVPSMIPPRFFTYEKFTQRLGANRTDPGVRKLWERSIYQLFVKKGVVAASLCTLNRIPLFAEQSGRLVGKTIKEINSTESEKGISAQWQDLVDSRKTSCLADNQTAFDLYIECGENVAKTPVLLLNGTQDPIMPFATSELVKCFFSNSKLLPVPDSGHIVFVDGTAITLSYVINFLQLPEDIDMTTVPESCWRCRNKLKEMLSLASLVCEDSNEDNEDRRKDESFSENTMSMRLSLVDRSPLEAKS